MLSQTLWLVVGLPIVLIGLVVVALIIEGERRFRKEQDELRKNHKGWTR